MALAGIHVECGFPGVTGGGDIVQNIMGKPVWSQNMTSPATPSTSSAPQGKNKAALGEGYPVMTIFAVADVFVAFGAAPNASQEPRALVKAGERRHFGVLPGDKVAYIAVP